ncbi:MAG: aminotransferase class I/II-fold pyridoxal phosphate-dependent enzyme, partial [Nitrososphaerales archaeon]
PKMARLRIASNTPVQMGAVEALQGPQDHVGEMVRKLKERRDYVMKRLSGMQNLSCAEPKGAFYIFPKIDVKGGRWKSDADFVIDLLKSTGVLTVHGSGFGTQYGFGHFRIVYLPPVEVLEEAMDRLEGYIR